MTHTHMTVACGKLWIHTCRQIPNSVIIHCCHGNLICTCMHPEQEAYIADLDAKSGASLKLTVLNQQGRIWTMVAGGGASVIYR